MQRRFHSAIEALVSTLVGFLISVAVWPPVSFHLLHRPPAIREGLAVVSVYTLISLLRGYLIRRFFNWMHTRPPALTPSVCFVCKQPAAGTIGGRWLCGYHGRWDR